MRSLPWRARWLAHWAGERGVGLILVAIAVAMAGGLAVVLIYDPTWLTGSVSGGQPGSESRSTTIRNVGLIGGGAIAILIAYWRSRLAQQDLLNKRYQEGAAMLGNDVLSVRLAGIYALERLAKDHPWDYHIEIMKLLCAFVRNPTGAVEARAEELREDVQAAMDAISACHARQLSLEERSGFQLDLRDADLRGASLSDANLSRALLKGAKLDRAYLRRSILYRAYLSDAGLTDATLINADLRGATLLSAILVSADLTAADLTPADTIQTFLTSADLTHAELFYAKMGGASLFGANLTDTRFTMEPHLVYTNIGPAEAIGLTQEELDHAFADPDNPPWLTGMVDPGTDKPLRPPFKGLDGTPHPKLDDDADD